MSARTRSVVSGDDPLQLTRSNIAMKPVQNLDSLNPATGLPNIGVLSFCPSYSQTNVLLSRVCANNRIWDTRSNHLNPSRLDTKSGYNGKVHGTHEKEALDFCSEDFNLYFRRVAAILEPLHTYTELVHSFKERQKEQQQKKQQEKQQEMEELEQMKQIEQLEQRKLELLEQQNLAMMEELAMTLPLSSSLPPHLVPSSLTTYSHQLPLLQPQNASFASHPHTVPQHPYEPPLMMPQPLPAPHPMDHHQHHPMTPFPLAPHPTPLPAYTTLPSTTLPHPLDPNLDVNNLTMNDLILLNQETLAMQQDVLDFKREQQHLKVNTQNPHDQHNQMVQEQNNNIACRSMSTRNMQGQRRSPQVTVDNLQSTYSSLLGLPKMASTPAETASSVEGESTILPDLCPDPGNLHMRKFDLSFKYQEAKFIEASILGHVPSILPDMGKVELEERLGERAKRIEKSIKDISKAYEDRCKQREKMRALMKYNIIEVEKGQNQETDEGRQRTTPKQFATKTSRSWEGDQRQDISDLGSSQESQTEISDFMSQVLHLFILSSFPPQALLKQHLSAQSGTPSKEERLRSEKRYSPRLAVPLLPLLEGEEGNATRGPWKSSPMEWQFQVSLLIMRYERSLIYNILGQYRRASPSCS